MLSDTPEYLADHPTCLQSNSSPSGVRRIERQRTNRQKREIRRVRPIEWRNSLHCFYSASGTLTHPSGSSTCNELILQSDLQQLKTCIALQSRALPGVRRPHRCARRSLGTQQPKVQNGARMTSSVNVPAATQTHAGILLVNENGLSQRHKLDGGALKPQSPASQSCTGWTGGF
jgi:hypothetical protein